MKSCRNKQWKLFEKEKIHLSNDGRVKIEKSESK